MPARAVRDLWVGLTVTGILSACLFGPGIALAFALGWLSPDGDQLERALRGYEATTRELRASSTALRMRCHDWPEKRNAGRTST